MICYRAPAPNAGHTKMSTTRSTIDKKTGICCSSASLQISSTKLYVWIPQCWHRISLLVSSITIEPVCKVLHSPLLFCKTALQCFRQEFQDKCFLEAQLHIKNKTDPPCTAQSGVSFRISKLRIPLEQKSQLRGRNHTNLRSRLR